MSLQFILGSSGAGKSHFIYDKIIKESMENPKTNYILLVPEQYSLALQRKMVMLHPQGGTMNIDVIGFNRLAYRVFDEQNYKPKKVLEDFGKTMLIRQVAGSVKDELAVYDRCLDKSGFIDEVKSLMSEMYQYDVVKDKLEEIVETLKEKEESKTLYSKLKDMLTIFRAFDKRIEEEYIVVEQITGILSNMIPDSKLISNSVIILDGFTGFTPIQLKLIGNLMRYAKKVYAVLTVDEKFNSKNKVMEHELFYLTYETKNGLIKEAKRQDVTIDQDIFITLSEKSRWISKELSHLEKNIFRYPYEKYDNEINDIKINVYDNPRDELRGISSCIKQLIMSGKYRYKDIAVITGDLEGSQFHVKQIMTDSNIPFFIDANQPVKNNPYIDALTHSLKLCEDGFSYDSVFSLLKSGIFEELGFDDIEKLENFVLKTGIRGEKYWNMTWENEHEETRKYFMEKLMPLYSKITDKNVDIEMYVAAVKEFMEAFSYEEKLEEALYEKLFALLDKMTEIMGKEIVGVSEFNELINLGLKDISLGRIPGTLDMVIVGDITRTRLDDIKVLFVIGVNDGIIPKKGANPQIINDNEKDKLSKLGFDMAPTDKMNSFIEQFYLYLNMTKPSHKLYISYTVMNNENEQLRPSYIVGRINNLFPKLKIENIKDDGIEANSVETGKEVLISGMQQLMEGNLSNLKQTMSLFNYYEKNDERLFIDSIVSAMKYNNLPESLSADVSNLIKLRLMSQSVSRLEKYASCAYSYFLQYTLGLKERSIKAIDNRDIGNILHSAMERLYRHVHDNLENSWDEISDASRDKLVEGFVNDAFLNEYESQLMEEGRYEYLRGMLIRIGKRTAKMLTSISKDNPLKPEFFEYRFSRNIPINSEGLDMKLTGIVDRGDICYSKEEGQIKLRIIDYKSGSHEFKIHQLYEGLQLQLSIYMNTMMELVKEKYSNNNELIVYPEGMYYYQMKDPYVDAANDEEAEVKRSKELSLKGLANTDTESFKAITDYSLYKAKSLAQEISHGNISKNPVVKEQGAVCEYCIYADVCRFDTKYGQNKFHYLKYKSKDKEAVLEEIKREMEEG